MYWPKLSQQKIKLKIFEALSKNANYRSENILGLPGTFLDTEVFYDGEPFLKDAPYLSGLISNPNHLGCHTLDAQEDGNFKGTLEIEKDLLRICAEEIFKAERNEYDGYVASGETEANIEALWIYRNYFQQEKNATPDEIVVLYSEDSHYSLSKGANLVGLDSLVFETENYTRQVDLAKLELEIAKALKRGKKHFIVILNLATLRFGSVDDLTKILSLLKFRNLSYKVHVDAGYGGFIYPFTNADNAYTFKHPDISSIALDGHKMVQAPYGTGIFLIRKNFMKYAESKELSAFRSKDNTLCGSRSGANAICLWMILHTYGSLSWTIKMNSLIERTKQITQRLKEMEVVFFHEPFVNIITIKSDFILPKLAKQFYLVPDKPKGKAHWYKLIIMPHVKQKVITHFLTQLEISLNKNGSYHQI